MALKPEAGDVLALAIPTVALAAAGLHVVRAYRAREVEAPAGAG